MRRNFGMDVSLEKKNLHIESTGTMDRSCFVQSRNKKESQSNLTRYRMVRSFIQLIIAFILLASFADTSSAQNISPQRVRSSVRASGSLDVSGIQIIETACQSTSVTVSAYSNWNSG